MGTGSANVARPDLFDLDKGISLSRNLKVAFVALVLVKPAYGNPPNCPLVDAFLCRVPRKRRELYLAM